MSFGAGHRFYDSVGSTYRRARKADPRIAKAIDLALGDARSVLNVGAGTGSYEPIDRDVTAVEPSEAMIAQRPPGAAPVIRAWAEALPLPDASFDAVMALMTTHQWKDVDRGLTEMQRVTRGRLLVLTFDLEVVAGVWIVAEYFPGMLTATTDLASSRRLAMLLPAARTQPILVPRDCSDHFFAALWARPELFLEDDEVEPMWAWRALSRRERSSGRLRLAEDLESGAWDGRHGDLRKRELLDVGLRLIVAGGGEGAE